jgi:radical SAM family uncharacterized protein/radical SAM-linked protein
MSHPYDPFLESVTKPAQYLGGEFHSIRKAWEDTPIHVALGFPDAYEIGMSHLGLRILYDILNAVPAIAAERVFAPWRDLEEKLREHQVSLVSLESARPLKDFDVLGFSLQYELTFTNILNMLDLAGLPIRSADRDNRHPLVVAGGPVATQPEPLAPFIDCFVIGDGERYFQRLIESYVAWRDEGVPRQEILIRLSRLGGIYCPSLYDVELEGLTGQLVVGKPKHDGVPPRVERKIVEDINAYPFPSRGPVPSTEIVFDRFSMEIARGCTEGCRFCQAGMIYRPVRERSPDQIIDTVLDAIREGGFDEAAITSLSTADFSCVSPLVKKLMERLKEEKVSLSVSSLRAYGLSGDLLEAISSVRNTSLTFAPEAGTQRMRDVVNKNISEEDMERSAHAVFSKGWKRCKLYFMIGLPTEEDADVLGIAHTARKYLEIAGTYSGRARCEITASVSSHVPKPHTPFQWARMDDIPEILRKQGLLQAEARDPRIKLKWHDAKTSHVEAILTRGDRRMADLIEYAFRSGCRFDGWSSDTFDVWMRGLEELRIDKYVYLRTIPLDARLPWDHIDVGLAPGFLAKEYQRALKNRLSPPCGKPFRAKVHPTNLEDAIADKRRLVCFDCGIACDMTKMREERLEFLTQLEAFKKQEKQDRPQEAQEGTGVAREPGSAPLKLARERQRMPRTAIVNRCSVRYRLLFTKLGPARLLSHLDVVRLLPRIFRRAALPMTYTLGFHPKPKMTFSPALSLGWASRGELLDIFLEGELEPPEVLSRLNRSSPEGMEFLAGQRLANGDLPLSRLLHAAEYWVDLPEERRDLDSVSERLEQIRSGKPVEIYRAKAMEKGPIEVSSAILSAALDPAQRRLQFLLRLSPSPAPRPDDLAAWVCEAQWAPKAIERRSLWCDLALLGRERALVSPLDLEKIRAQGVLEAAPVPVAP